VARTYNPIYWGGGNEEEHCYRTGRAKRWRDPMSIHKMGIVVHAMLEVIDRRVVVGGLFQIKV
jgi:hypothetical protein